MLTADWGACDLQHCSIQQSIFKYRPNLTANSLFIALFGLSGVIQAIQGARYRQWIFSSLITIGCASEIIGYGGRIIMYNDPWAFDGFIIQIVCITIAPVFMTAAIYVTLYESILRLSPSSARFRPARYFQFFIPCDIISLVLQSVGGAMSATAKGSLKTGVNIGLAGLSFQVFTLLIFIVLAADYARRYRGDVAKGRIPSGKVDRRFKFFLAFLSLATVLIFIRCAYRIYELSDGYGGPAMHSQGLFIGLESCMIILAVYALNLGHPGPVFESRFTSRKPGLTPAVENSSDNSSEEHQDKATW